MRSFALIALLAATAAADDKQHAALLEKGRVLEHDGKHAEAIAAYEEFLKTAPDDPVANAELGFAALQAKDLKKAERATRLAIAHAAVATFPGDALARPRGAALFNLGMIQEAQNLPKDAAVSYGESLKSRPSRVAREKLQKLDAGLAATLDPLAPSRLAGPFKDLTDACRDAMVKAGGTGDETWGENGSCKSLDMIAIANGKKPGAPFEQIVAFQMDDRSSLDFGVKMKDGWFLLLYPGKGHRGSAHCGGTHFTVKSLGVTKRAATELRLEYTSDGSCFHRAYSWDWNERGTILIGVGASGRPSAPPMLVTVQKENGEGDLKKWVETDAVMTLALNADGSLDLTGKVRHPTMASFQPITEGDLDPDNLLGHHLIVFP